MSDFYKTLSAPSSGVYKEKMSKFLAFAQPVETVDDAKAVIKQYQNKYCDARHCCWAYMLGVKHTQYQASDNGEPSGTAGRPILGQINSFGLTNVVVVVVRYFGGIKLGTPGLIAAYREAARLAIEAGDIVERHEQAQVSITFPYLAMNGVMHVVKHSAVKVLSQEFDNTCRMALQCDASAMPGLTASLSKVEGVKIDEG